MKVSLDADQETVRAAYIGIVKIVHPDSGHPEASAEKFAEVDNAFRILLEKYAKERRGIQENDDVQEHDIKVKSYRIRTIQISEFNFIPTAHSTTASTVSKL